MALAVARTLLTLGTVALALAVLHGDRGLLGPRPAAAPGTVPGAPLSSLPVPVTGADPRPRQAAPVELTIPVLGLRSPLDRLDANPDGTLRAPADPGTAGWYGGGPYPGDAASPPALIVGRAGTPTGVFARLGELRPGNSVVVRAGDGGTSVFEVYKVVRFPGTGLPTGPVYAASSRAELRLVTRADRASAGSTATDTLVVYAALRSPEPTGTPATPASPGAGAGPGAPAGTGARDGLSIIPAPPTGIPGVPAPVAPTPAPSSTAGPTPTPTGPADSPAPATSAVPPTGAPTPAPIGGGLVRPT